MRKLTDEFKKERGWFFIGKCKYYWRNCDNCGIEYKGQGSKYCSYSCNRLASPIILCGDNNPSKRDYVRKKISESKKGVPPSINTINACIKAHKGFYGKEAKNGRWRGDDFLRNNHSLFRGRNEWKEWRKSVYERDGYKCLDCGSSKELEPHHIIPLRVDKLLVFEITNGVTLCRQCHQKTFGREMEFVNIYKSLIPKA
ncbi:MAG TPA: HNH endonuclease [Candidatus Pelethenecus sp.]|nr:HNH endonuclease [Candidatus Pelethenecus sp.]